VPVIGEIEQQSAYWWAVELLQEAVVCSLLVEAEENFSLLADADSFPVVELEAEPLPESESYFGPYFRLI